MEKSIDELVYALSCECKEAVYSNIEHKEFIRQMAKKLETLAWQIQREHSFAMLESSYEFNSLATYHTIDEETYKSL